MSADTDRSPYSLGFTTLKSEVSVDALPMRGSLPAWLGGSLLRTGPARFEVGAASYKHWFDGLAMLHRFSFADGRVSYANRYLESQAYREATERGTISRGEFATDPCRTLFQRVASWFTPRLTDNGCINIAALAEAVVALPETRLPVQFDPATLETLGVREYDRPIEGPVSTAHPHYDVVRRCHYNYVLAFGRNSTYRFFKIDEATGEQSVVADIGVQRPAYVHSFGMSERFLVLIEYPFVVNPLKLRFGGRPFIRNYKWDAERGARLSAIDKDSGRVILRADVPAFFAFHHVNAFEDGDELLVDLITYRDATVIDQLFLDHLRSAAPVIATGELTRCRVRASGEVAFSKLSEVPVELPRIDYYRHAGRRYRHVYGVSQSRTGDFLDSLVKLDLETERSVFWSADGCYPGEPVFVEAPGAQESEDAGVVLSVVLDVQRGVSFLLILDAATFSEIARAEAPHHIPFGFHGNYLT